MPRLKTLVWKRVVLTEEVAKAGRGMRRVAPVWQLTIVTRELKKCPPGTGERNQKKLKKRVHDAQTGSEHFEKVMGPRQMKERGVAFTNKRTRRNKTKTVNLKQETGELQGGAKRTMQKTRV